MPVKKQKKTIVAINNETLNKSNVGHWNLVFYEIILDHLNLPKKKYDVQFETWQYILNIKDMQIWSNSQVKL